MKEYVRDNKVSIYDKQVKIEVVKFCPNCNGRALEEEGKEVYKKIEEYSKLDYKIILNFKYVKIINEAFFMQILKNEKCVKPKSIQFANLSLEQKMTLRNVVLMIIKEK